MSLGTAQSNLSLLKGEFSSAVITISPYLRYIFPLFAPLSVLRLEVHVW